MLDMKSEKTSHSNSQAIVIVGAGIVGVLMAYALAKRGQKVVVLERERAPAEACSFANAGILAIGHASAWAKPQAIPTIASAFLGRQSGVRVSRRFDPQLWRWGLGFISQCTTKRHLENTAKLQVLARYSRELSKTIEADLGLNQQLRHEGGLYVFRDTAQFGSYQASLAAYGGDGLGELETLTADALVAKEPALKSLANELVGGLYSSVDSVGDCHDFALRVSQALQEKAAVVFHFDVEVTGFSEQSGRITALQTTAGSMPASQVILTSGANTPAFTKQLGFSPLIYPVKGYSGTWSVVNQQRMPKRPFIDETSLVAVSSYNNLLRVTTTAEFAGYDTSLNDERVDFLKTYVGQSFADAVDSSSASFWAGLRPTTPTGTPYLGRVKHYKNLWLNAGHGQLGWTMAAGSGELLAAKLVGLPIILPREHLSLSERKRRKR